MVSKARLGVLLALLGLISASVFIADALHRHFWASLAFGIVVLAGCLAYLVRLESPVVQDPPVIPRQASAEHRPATFLADHVPMPLLEFQETRGLIALNRAARTLFGTDDLVLQPPAGWWKRSVTASRGPRGR
jgi:two-component system, NtrC family, nitrogen regulation sensor histidine kinase NtrY